MRVDFPAPFSPISACTSPLRSVKSTWSRAWTPGKRNDMPTISTAGATASTMTPLPRWCRRLAHDELDGNPGPAGNLSTVESGVQNIHRASAISSFAAKIAVYSGVVLKPRAKWYPKSPVQSPTTIGRSRMPHDAARTWKLLSLLRASSQSSGPAMWSTSRWPRPAR